MTRAPGKDKNMQIWIYRRNVVGRTTQSWSSQQQSHWTCWIGGEVVQ